MLSSENINDATRAVRRDQYAAEAGPGAANTDAVPVNETREAVEDESSGRLSGSDKSDAHQDGRDAAIAADEKNPARPELTRKDSTPLEERGRGQIALIMFALCMAVFLAALDVTIVTTALPTISEHFHSSAGYTWIGSAYLLGNASSVPTWGKVSDIFGRKPVLLIANVVFMIGSLVAALSNSIGMLIAARAIQGIGGGGLVTLVNICISDLFSIRRRGAYFGIIGGIWAISSAIGPIIGGAFSEKVSWRWCFYINLPCDGLAFFIILFFLDLKTPKTPLWDGLKAIDWLGSLLIVGGVLMFLFGLEYGGVTYPWDSATVLCLLIIGVFTIGLFGLNEWKFAKYPVMPLRLFNDRSNIAAFGCCFVHGFVFIASSYYLPLYFQAVRGASPLLSGVYLLPSAIALSFSSIATGIFIRKSGLYLPPIYIGFFFMTLGYGLFIDFDANSGWAKIIIFQIIAGIGIGPNFQAPLIALQTHIKPRDIATATATFGFIRQLATSISVVVGSVVYQNEMAKKAGTLTAALGPQIAAELSGSGAGANVELIDSLPAAGKKVVRVAFANSLQPMWIMYTCIAVVGLVVSFFIKKRVLNKQHEETKVGLENQKNRKEMRDIELQERAAAKAAESAPVDKDVERGLHD